MEKKIISDFQEFGCNVTELDKIKGGKKIDEVVFTGCGPDGDGGRCCEALVIYDDDTWEHVFACN